MRGQLRSCQITHKDSEQKTKKLHNFLHVANFLFFIKVILMHKLRLAPNLALHVTSIGRILKLVTLYKYEAASYILLRLVTLLLSYQCCLTITSCTVNFDKLATLAIVDNVHHDTISSDSDQGWVGKDYLYVVTTNCIMVNRSLFQVH